LLLKSDKITIFPPPLDSNLHALPPPPLLDVPHSTEDIPVMDAAVLSMVSDTDVLYSKIMIFAKNAKLQLNILTLLSKSHPPRPQFQPNQPPNKKLNTKDIFVMGATDLLSVLVSSVQSPRTSISANVVKPKNLTPTL